MLVNRPAVIEEAFAACEDADAAAEALADALERRRVALKALAKGGSIRINRQLHRAAVDRALHFHGIGAHCSLEHVGAASRCSLVDQGRAVMAGPQMQEA